MVRYKLPEDVRHLFSDDKKTKIPLPWQPKEQPRTVNILEEHPDWYKVRVYLADGSVVEGLKDKVFWPPFEFVNEEELFDGRFNA